MEKLNRALCELGYSFSTVIVIVVEMFVILVKMSNNWKREAPPTLSYCFTNWKELPAKSAALVWVAFEIGKWWWWSAKTKIEKLWNDKGGENRDLAPTKWCDALIQHLKTNIHSYNLFILVTYELKHCQRHNGPRNWLRNLDWTWQQYGTTYISCKFDHLMAPLTLVANLATCWHHLH